MACGCSHMQTGKMCGKIRCDIFCAGDTEFCVGRSKAHKQITQVKCHDGYLLFLKACLSVQEESVFFSLHLWQNRPSCLFTIVSFSFLFFLLPSNYHYHYYGSHERRKAKEAYNIRYWSTPITTQRKKVGSGAAQFRLDSAIDRMLYQPLPWQLTEQGQSPGVYLHLSFTPCHLVLVPGSLCWFKCPPEMLYTVIPIIYCIYDCFFVIVQFAFASSESIWDFLGVHNICVSMATVCLHSLHKCRGLYFALTPICRSKNRRRTG